jgi:hypothetical protein
MGRKGMLHRDRRPEQPKVPAQPTPETPKRQSDFTENDLTPEQWAYLTLITNPRDKRGVTEKAAAVGVSRQTVYQWSRTIPIWAELRARMVQDWMEAELCKTIKALVDKAQAGDIPAARLHMEAAGAIRGPGSTVTVGASATATTAPSWLSEVPDDELVKVLRQRAKIGGPSAS